MFLPILRFIFYKMLFLLFRFSQTCISLLICICDCFNLRYKRNYNFYFIIPVSLLPFPFLFSFLLCSAENWTHGLTHAWQELFYWVTFPVLFTLFSWSSLHRSSLNFSEISSSTHHPCSLCNWFLSLSLFSPYCYNILIELFLYLL